jgi:hypothetical protein
MFPQRFAFSLCPALVLALALQPRPTTRSQGGSGPQSASSAQQAPVIVIGVVVFQSVPPGQEVSASLTAEPDKYAGIPALEVVKIQIPAAEIEKQSPGNSLPNTVALKGVVVDMGDGRKQSGDNNLVVAVPAAAESIAIVVSLVDKPGTRLGQTTIPVEKPGAPPPQDFTSSATSSDVPRVTMPPVMTAGGVQVMHGQTVGNSAEMKVTVDDQPARIVAAKPGTAFWDVQETLAPGPHRVTVWPGPAAKPLVFTLYVIGFIMTADNLHLLRGQSTDMHVTVTGLENLPVAAWTAAAAPSDLVDIASVEQRAKGFRPPKPQEPGTVLLLLENHSPAQIRMGKAGDRIVLVLHQKDFASGPYTYQDRLRSLSSGGFNISGTVVAFLKDAQGSR